MSKRFAGLIAGWDRFWFLPQQTSTLAIFRIAFGLVTTGWTVSLIPNLFAFFGPKSVFPSELPRTPGVWGLFDISASRPVIIVLLVATLAGSIALTVGLRTRLAAVVAFLGILSFQRANPLVWNSGDALLRNLALFCALAPSGEALSLDRLRTAPGHFWEFPLRAPWALRLIQIQLSLLYFSTVWDKLQGDTWRGGTAVSYALRITDIHRFPTPSWVTNSVILTEMLTFGTLALELALAVLVWNRVARPWVLCLGVMLHLIIDYSILIGFFTLALFTAYLAFLPPEAVSRRILALRDRFRRRSPPAVTAPGEPQQGGGTNDDTTVTVTDTPSAEVPGASGLHFRGAPRVIRQQSSEAASVVPDSQ